MEYLQTNNRFSGTGISKDPVEKLVKKVINNRTSMANWLQVRVLILDEVSMIDGHFLDKIDQVARKVRKNQKVFGGIQVVILQLFYFYMIIHP